MVKLVIFLAQDFLSCERPCDPLELAMICRIKIYLESYSTMSRSVFSFDKYSLNLLSNYFSVYSKYLKIWKLFIFYANYEYFGIFFRTACGNCPKNSSDCFQPGCIFLEGFTGQRLLTANRNIPGPTIKVFLLLLFKYLPLYLLSWVFIIFTLDLERD